MTEQDPQEPTAPTPEPSPPSVDQVQWVSPSSETPKRSRTGCAIGAVIGVIALVVVVYVGLVFLGGQVQTLLAGTVQVGTGGNGCSVTGEATSFPTSTASIHVVAYLEREAVAGETVAVTLHAPDGSKGTQSLELDSAATCVSLDLPLGGALPVGAYTLDYAIGSEVLATGGFELHALDARPL